MMKPKFNLLKFFISLALMMGLAALSVADITDGLVGYWPLDDAVKDEAGKHDGKLDGGAKFVKDADRGQVLEVDGAIGPKVAKPSCHMLMISPSPLMTVIRCRFGSMPLLCPGIGLVSLIKVATKPPGTDSGLMAVTGGVLAGKIYLAAPPKLSSGIT